MTRDQITQFNYKYQQLQQAVEALPRYTDDPEAYMAAIKEIEKLTTEVGRLNPPQIEPLR